MPATSRPDPNPIATNFVPRGVKLTAKDFEQHEYTAGCPGCAFAMTGAPGSRNHSAECRERMEDLIAKDDVGGQQMI